MKRYVLSKAADADLAELFAYGAQTFGEPQARRYMTSLLKTLDVLADFPAMARERTEASAPVRVHHHRKHYIVYRAMADHIMIVRILREEADLDAFLSDPN